jgi:hypothetical protein
VYGICIGILSSTAIALWFNDIPVEAEFHLPRLTPLTQRVLSRKVEDMELCIKNEALSVEEDVCRKVRSENPVGRSKNPVGRSKNSIGRDDSSYG